MKSSFESLSKATSSWGRRTQLKKNGPPRATITARAVAIAEIHSTVDVVSVTSAMWANSPKVSTREEVFRPVQIEHVCEHTFVGNAGTASGRLRTALNTGSYGLAVNLARELPHVDLADAIRLACLAATKDPDRFDAMALRCLVRLAEERGLLINEAIWALQRFQDAREGVDGETGLMKLAKSKPGDTRIG